MKNQQKIKEFSTFFKKRKFASLWDVMSKIFVHFAETLTKKQCVCGLG